MAFLFVDSLLHKNSRFHTVVKALELLLIFAGLVSTLLMLTGSLITSCCDMVVSSIIGFWNSCKCLLASPLYICVVINFMVLLIAASSILQRHEGENHEVIYDGDEDTKLNELNLVSPPPAPPPEETHNHQPRAVTEDCNPPQIWKDGVDQIFVDEKAEIFSLESFSDGVLFGIHESKKKYSLISSLTEEKGKEKRMEEENEFQLDNKEEAEEEEEEEEDTLDATWKAITSGGKEKAGKKQLKKSETWNVAPPSRAVAVQSLDLEDLLPAIPASLKELRKSETFNDAVSIRKRGGLMRDPSMSVEEFNKQVEAFIKKFNDSMRLQRQESDQRFIDMINRGL